MLYDMSPPKKKQVTKKTGGASTIRFLQGVPKKPYKWSYGAPITVGF